MKIYLLYQLVALIVRNILLSLRKFEEKENGRIPFWLILNEKFTLNYH